MTEPIATPWPDATRRVQVGDVVIDLRYRTVEHPGGRTELTQRLFDLLRVFLAEPGVLLTRATLFGRVWPGLVVEDANLSQGVWMLRRALGPERKDWIRTVAKAGYVFEPPGPVVPDPTPPPPAEAARPAVPMPPAAVPRTAPSAPDLAITDPPPRRRPARRTWAMLATAALALGVVAVSGLEFSMGASAGTGNAPHAAAPALVVDVAVAPHSAGAVDDAWPVEVLADTVEWQLDLVPSVVRTEGHAAPAPGQRIARVVLARADADDGQAGFVLEARVTLGDGRKVTLREPATDATVARAVDALAARVTGRLVPTLRGAPWPSTPGDAVALKAYAAAARAWDARDWAGAERAADAAVATAPTYGLAHHRLAELATLRGARNEARDHAAAARAALLPLPAEADAVMAARTAWRDDTRRGEALAAFAALATQHPARLDFALAHAGLLIHAGEPHQAARVLEGDRWRAATPLQAIRRLLTLADAQRSRLALPEARRTVQEALQMIARDPRGRDAELGRARMLAAALESQDPSRPRSPALFALAADAYEAAGDPLHRDYARFVAGTYDPAMTPARMEAMAAQLLVDARRVGDVPIEVAILRQSAWAAFALRDYTRYRALLREAYDSTVRAGDVPLQRMLEIDLVHDDLLQGRYASADARAARLPPGTTPGGQGYWLATVRADLMASRGRHAQALQGLDIEERALNGGRPTPVPEGAWLAIARARSHLALGALDRARAELERVRTANIPMFADELAELQGGVDLLSGDLPRARLVVLQAADAADALPPGSSERDTVPLGLAPLLVKVGEPARAERMLERALPGLREAGFTALVATAEVGLAEAAAARGDWPRARAMAASARSRIPREMAPLVARLDLLALQEARARGDGAVAQALATRLQRDAKARADAWTLQALQARAR